MNKQTATTTAAIAPNTHKSAKSHQQTNFYDVLTQLTLQQMRQRASQRT